MRLIFYRPKSILNPYICKEKNLKKILIGKTGSNLLLIFCQVFKKILLCQILKEYIR